MIELAGNLKKGVPMATPVFDGANEEDIKIQLESSLRDLSGETRSFRDKLAISTPEEVGLELYKNAKKIANIRALFGEILPSAIGLFFVLPIF